MICHLSNIQLLDLLQEPSQCTYPKVLQKSEAVARWDEWESNLENDASIFWMNIENVLHIRLAVKFSLNYRTTSVRQNAAIALVKSVKKADGATVASEAAKIGQDMNKFGDADVDFMNKLGDPDAALVEDRGKTLGGGHYVTYVQSSFFVCCNDADISEIT